MAGRAGILSHLSGGDVSPRLADLRHDRLGTGPGMGQLWLGDQHPRPVPLRRRRRRPGSQAGRAGHITGGHGPGHIDHGPPHRHRSGTGVAPLRGLGGRGGDIRLSDALQRLLHRRDCGPGDTPERLVAQLGGHEPDGDCGSAGGGTAIRKDRRGRRLLPASPPLCLHRLLPAALASDPAFGQGKDLSAPGVGGGAALHPSAGGGADPVGDHPLSSAVGYVLSNLSARLRGGRIWGGCFGAGTAPGSGGDGRHGGLSGGCLAGGFPAQGRTAAGGGVGPGRGPASPGLRTLLLPGSGSPGTGGCGGQRVYGDQLHTPADQRLG